MRIIIFLFFIPISRPYRFTDTCTSRIPRPVRGARARARPPGRTARIQIEYLLESWHLGSSHSVRQTVGRRFALLPIVVS